MTQTIRDVFVCQFVTEQKPESFFSGAKVRPIVLVLSFGRWSRQLRTAALQPVPASLAAIRITVKSLADRFPRVASSGILLEADELVIVDFCPSPNGMADARCWSRSF